MGNHNVPLQAKLYIAALLPQPPSSTFPGQSRGTGNFSGPRIGPVRPGGRVGLGPAHPKKGNTYV